MRWEEERYVRVYTRDTPDWIALPWEARAVFYELLRKVDRAGLVPMGRSGERGLAALLMMPFSVVEPGLAALLEDGCVVRSGTDLVVRRFIEAQEARQSDRARQRDSRERARAKAIGSATAVDSPPASEPTDAGSDTSDGAAKPPAEKTNDIAVGLSHGVTSGHQRSPAVTNCHSVPSRTVPSLTLSEGSGAAAPTSPPVRAKAKRARRAPADQPSLLGTDAPAEPKPEKPDQVAWRLWRETYAASRRGYGPYVAADADGRAMRALAKRAAEEAERSGLALADVLAHWFRNYLRDDGMRNALVENRHPLHWLDRGLPTYGLPRAASQPKPPPAEPQEAPTEPLPSREETMRMAQAAKDALRPRSMPVARGVA